MLGEIRTIGVAPSDETDITFALDYTRQRPDGYAQVLAGVVPTLRAPARQFWQIVDDLGYTPPNVDAATQTVRPFDRVKLHKSFRDAVYRNDPVALAH